MSRPASILVVLTGLVTLGAAEFFMDQVECDSPGYQYTFAETEVLFCDRTGRRFNLMSFCKSRQPKGTGTSARIIFDASSSAEESATQSSRPIHNFPPLCLPGTKAAANKGAWRCTCSPEYPNSPRYRYSCVLAENQPAPTFFGRSINGRIKQVANAYLPPEESPVEGRSGNASVTTTTTTSATTATTAAETTVKPRSTPAPSGVTAEQAGEKEESRRDTREARGYNGSSMGAYRQHGVTTVVYLDYCDEFAYLRTLSDCLWKEPKDQVPTKPDSKGDINYIYENSQFDAYECLPGVYRARCESCEGPPENKQCHAVPCPQS